MTLVNRRHNPPPAAAKPRQTSKTFDSRIILESDDADRSLIGYGVSALIDVFNGMGYRRSSLNDVKAVYLSDTDYEYYVTQGIWRELSCDRKENRQNATTLRYMLAKRLLRRGMPDPLYEIPRQQKAWSLAVHGRVMRLM